MKKFLHTIQNEIQIFCLPNRDFGFDSANLLRYQMSILASLLASVSYLEMAILYIIDKQYKIAALDLFGCVSVLFGLFFIKKYNFLNLLVNLSLAISSILIHIKIHDTGGIYSIQFQFLFLIPLIAIVCTTWQYITFWIMVTIAQYLYFFGPYNQNVFLFSSFTFWDDILMINSYLLVISISYGLIYAYKKIIEHSDKKLSELNVNLNEKNSSLAIILQNEEQKQEEMTVLLETIINQNETLEERKNELSIINQKIINYTKIITQLAKLDSIKLGNLQESVEEFTKLICEAVNCSRTSVWFYNENKTIITCKDLFSKTENSHENGLYFEIENYHEYYKLLESEGIFVNNNVFDSEESKIFLNNYFIPNNIISNIDIPIYVYGELKGILSCENQIDAKEWKQEDINFLRSAAELVSLAYVSNQHIIAEQTIKAQRNEIEAINKGLEARIDARTAKLVEKNLQLSEFAFMHAHVLRAPICRILGLGSLLDLKLVETEEEKKDVINRIIENTKELETNLKDITKKLDNYKS